MQQLQQLKGFDPTQHNVEEMICLLALANGMIGVYIKFGEVPDWLTEKRDSLEKSVENATRDELERQLKETEGRIEALKSADDKRSDLKDKAARLKAKLQGPKAVAA